MALVLGLNIGDVVDIANDRIAVLSANSRHKATLLANGGRKVTVFAKSQVELLRDVWVQLGPWISKKHVKLLLDAPKSISRWRGFDLCAPRPGYIWRSH